MMASIQEALGRIDIAPCVSGGIGPNYLEDSETGTKNLNKIDHVELVPIDDRLS